MSSEAITTAARPYFITYLLPSLNFSRPSATIRSSRRRQSSATSASSTASDPSLNASSTSTSFISSENTSPSSSPPLFYQRRQSYPTFTSVANEGEIEAAGVENETDFELRLTRVQPETLKCSTCSTDLAFASQIISKGFTGRHGRAYLVSPPQASPSLISPTAKVTKNDGNLVNIEVHKSVSRQLVTGAHVVADISCVVCKTVVGWKYVDAKEAAQKYKIGKFILETRRIAVGKNWEDIERHSESPRDCLAGRESASGASQLGEEAVIFDSEDEDECDDLFTGVWDPEIVKKRRRRRIGSRRRDE